MTGHINLSDAIDGTITYEGSDGRHYQLGQSPATLLVRPRGWHLPERHVFFDGEPVAAASSTSACTLFHCAPRLLAQWPGPISTCRSSSTISRRAYGTTSSAFAQDALGIPRGTIRATVLIETFPAAFQMEEILFELREHSAGSTRAAGTTSSRRSSASQVDVRWCCPTAPTSR